MWFKFENGQILIGTQDDARRVRNVKRHNRVTVVIDNPELPIRGALIYGKAELDYDNQLPKRVSIFLKYMPRDKAQALAQGLTKMWKLVILRIKPERIVSWDYGKDPTGMFK